MVGRLTVALFVIVAIWAMIALVDQLT